MDTWQLENTNKHICIPNYTRLCTQDFSTTYINRGFGFHESERIRPNTTNLAQRRQNLEARVYAQIQKPERSHLFHEKRIRVRELEKKKIHIDLEMEHKCRPHIMGYELKKNIHPAQKVWNLNSQLLIR